MPQTPHVDDRDLAVIATDGRHAPLTGSVEHVLQVLTSFADTFVVNRGVHCRSLPRHIAY
jgi:hypothetical protein